MNTYLAIQPSSLKKSAKHKGSGQAAIIEPDQIEVLFERGFIYERDRCLFAICLLTGCRISEALQLRWEDITNSHVNFRAETTKTKQGRQFDLSDGLKHWIGRYVDESFSGDRPVSGWLFPSRRNGGAKPITRAAADLILKEACEVVGLDGISTHSFRRTFITTLATEHKMNPRQIAQQTGHSSLANVLKYID